MPKIKSHSGMKKRFKVNKNGKVKLSGANSNHLLRNKSTKSKRSRRKGAIADSTNAAEIKRLLPYK